MTHKPALLCAVAAVLSPLGAHALGLGDITLNSALNEPLDAEIRLTSAAPDELRSLRATLATRDTFERYGLDYPEFLSGLRFTVTDGASGPLLKVTSRRPIPEPFVTFLIEADWSSGRLLREYTVLLDPPVFMPAEQAPAPVAAPRTSVTPSAPSRGTVTRPAPAAPAPAAAPPSRPVAPAAWDGGSQYGPVRRNETLYEIALRVRPDRSISPNQMMMALFNANPQAFGGNINVLRQGATLNVPSAAQIRGVSNAEALASVRRHNQDWRAGRPQASAAAAPSPAAAAPATDSAAGRLRLVSPESGSATAAGTAGSGADAAALSAARERLADAEAQAADLRSELETARSELAEARRLIELRDAEFAELQKNLADRAAGETTPAPDAGVTDATEPAAATPGVDLVDTGDATDTTLPADTTVASDVEPADAVADAASPVAAPATPTVIEPEPEPEARGFFAGIIDSIKSLGSWLWIGLLALVALAAAAALALRGRRSAATDDWEAELTAAAGASELDDETRIRPQTEASAAPAAADEVEYLDDTGTFKPVDFAAAQADGDSGVEAPSETAEYPFEDTLAGDASMNLDQADPLAEADFHMAYGLYDQAAELVKKASDREPDRRDLKHKLLEIFFVWGNKSAFLEGARELRQSMGANPDAEWDKIVIMGRQICPEDALFSADAGGTVAAQAIDLDLEAGTQGTDFDFGDESLETPAQDAMDLDLGEALAGSAAVVGGTEIQPAPVDVTQDDNVLDFDLGLDDSDADTAEQSGIEAVREKIESGHLTSEETAEMDLESLGLGADDSGFQDFIETTETTAAGHEKPAKEEEDLDVDDLLGDFDAFTSLSDDSDDSGDETVQRLAPDFSAEAADEEIDLDLGLGDLASISSIEDDETEGELVTLDANDGGDADDGEHFSAEIETLSGESIDMDFSDLVGDDSPPPAAVELPPADTGQVATAIGPDDETVLADLGEFTATGTGAGTGTDFGEVFGADDETVLTDTGDEPMPADDSVTQMFGPTDVTEEMDQVDLDVGDMFEESDQQPTTMKVPAAELALPESDDDDVINEVGTKLDLARAYMDMGDPDGARGILEEVLEEGDETQQQDARELLANLG